MSWTGPLIDMDVHHMWPSRDALVAYLPEKWRRYADDSGHPLVPALTRWLLMDSAFRLDLVEGADGLPGASYETLRSQLLDVHGTTRAHLTYNVGLQGGIANPQFAAEVVRAANRHTADHWLATGDPRLSGTILVPTEVPELAVEEIEFWSDHRAMRSILMVANPLGRPFGHRVYDPIYRAATEAGRPVAFHVGGDGIGSGQESPGGNTGTMLERYAASLGAPGMHHLSSMISQGLFGRFPTLKVAMLEFGFTWLPSLAWRMDAAYADLQRECPWVTELPSETLRRHVKLSTQPLEYVRRAAMIKLLGTFPPFEDMLCYSSDYPHWDEDDPRSVQTLLPKTWASKVFHENASDFFGDPVAVSAGERAR